MTPQTTDLTIKLRVPRHLQDYNGYCGPACAMMVISAEPGVSVPAQQALFRDIREHAKQANDRRPVKSPAESLLALISRNSKVRWSKIFDPVPDKIAARLIHAVANLGRPCLMLISRGMHWVVGFGRTLRDDGTVAGVLMRDPAWAGMPPFYGLTVFPEKSTFSHGADPCICLQSDNPPGSVHERYMAMEELVSPRGLQGSPDWEGKGALALVPDEPESTADAL